MSIQETIDGITPEEKRRLLYAFNNSFCQVVTLSRKSFIGVNCTHVSNLEIQEQQGPWAVGTFK